MQPLLRTAGFSLLLLAASCGVGAQPEPQNSRLTAIKTVSYTHLTLPTTPYV